MACWDNAYSNWRTIAHEYNLAGKLTKLVQERIEKGRFVYRRVPVEEEATPW